jgi:hypothetical protein
VCVQSTMLVCGVHELADTHTACMLPDNMEADMKMLQQPDLTPAERTAAQARGQTHCVIACPVTAAQLDDRQARHQHIMF